MGSSHPGTIPINTFVLEVGSEKPASLNAITEDIATHITMAALDIASSNSTAPTVVKLTTRPKVIEEYPEKSESKDKETDSTKTTVICVLSPKNFLQQKLDLFFLPNEHVAITVEGPHKVSLTGYLVVHPLNESDGESEDDLYTTAKVEEPPIQKKINDSRKRYTEESEISVEKAKKPKKTETKNAFLKELKQGPSAKSETTKVLKIQKLAGGVTTEDKKVGSGATCKKGDKVLVRYIGKLKNGKTFDSNTKGEPFQFKLGVGQVIKGWDIGVTGMSVKGERRITIPASMAYGSQTLPGIPANSTLIFDVKLVGLK